MSRAEYPSLVRSGCTFVLLLGRSAERYPQPLPIASAAANSVSSRRSCARIGRSSQGAAHPPHKYAKTCWKITKKPP